jgi:putative transposase
MSKCNLTQPHTCPDFCPRYNHLEQDHRAVKGRYRPMRGFQTHLSAARFCRAHDEVRDFFRPATRRKEHVPAARRRAIHVQRVAALRDMLAVA